MYIYIYIHTYIHPSRLGLVEARFGHFPESFSGLPIHGAAAFAPGRSTLGPAPGPCALGCKAPKGSCSALEPPCG